MIQKTRADTINDKLLGMEMRAHKARYITDEDERLRNIRIIGTLYGELWTIVNTSEEKGREWQWWE